MATQQRKERERAQRESLIVEAAREMAEADGWPSVTVRKLAERIEYSQPVLYSHFAGRSAIIDAVALQGCAELAVILDKAGVAGPEGGGLAAVARAYLDFANTQPAVFDAIFSLAEGLPFGPDAPEPLKAAFASLYRVFAPLAKEGQDPDAFTETGWAAIHGLAVLSRTKRLRPDLERHRLEILVRQFTSG
ncbi:TetR/AcrR family transcriptional regulator [Glycomyces rhizosphaerae]|uniref:TetR/AcrR family transcriptional regulator n=1 Tax=Glycomyces rhizosphaerae TaxID=2054422 RepID=A0ABV7PWV0_9ACTN